jgi:poly(hydroxyalkanoate) granule-associated protein
MLTKSEVKTKAHKVRPAQEVHDMMTHVWQAGLGALARAQEEGGEVYANLVKEGAQLQSGTLGFAREGAAGASVSVAKLADEVGKQTVETLRKLEKRLEKSIARAMHRLGVPERKAFDALVKRVDQLAGAGTAGKRRAAAAAKAAPASRRKPVRAALAKAPAKPKAGSPAKTAMKRRASKGAHQPAAR